jgi:hypothetical protein
MNPTPFYEEKTMNRHGESKVLISANGGTLGISSGEQCINHQNRFQSTIGNEDDMFSTSNDAR